MQRIHVNLAGSSYDILIKSRLLHEAGNNIPLPQGRKLAVVCDSRVAALYSDAALNAFAAAGYEASLVITGEGEASKSMDMIMRLYDKFIELNISRGDGIVALGGGTTGDSAGFAAATYLRGVPLFMIPTTLLSQVDSSVGGKTAINLPQGKNLVGAFHQPSGVIIDTSLLSTLEPRQFASGMAEVIKTAAIADAELFSQLERFDNTALHQNLDRVIARCCEIKRGYVQDDALDTGVRMQLNFGHTLGHAIEAAAGYGEITHGEGVAIGMYAAARFGESEGITPLGSAERIKAVLQKNNLPYKAPHLEGVLSALKKDKKAGGGAVKLVLLESIGRTTTLEVSLDRAALLWEAVK
ncbi:MAG: 3-dehydroquinate synthase [Christensenellales bacterium]|jgi:3-dehydroquinate synthase